MSMKGFCFKITCKYAAIKGDKKKVFEQFQKTLTEENMRDDTIHT